MTHSIRVRPREPSDDRDVAAVPDRCWGGRVVVSRGVAHDAFGLPGLVAEGAQGPPGLVTYDVRGDPCEVGLRRLWLVISNDNTAAPAFYQRCGLRIVAVHPGTIDAARRRKPTIPLVGAHGIEVHDEIELALVR